MASALADQVEHHVRQWLTDFVVGLNLCPFARPLLGASNLRIKICEQGELADLQHAFLQELDVLQRSQENAVATTLLVFPSALQDFDDYLHFLEDCQNLLAESGLEGMVQLASFHPQYCFAGEAPDAASHFSNRAPYPIIHLLREDMLSRALDDFPDPGKIPDKNIATLNTIGADELSRRWQALFTQ